MTNVGWCLGLPLAHSVGDRIVAVNGYLAA
jgi:hypothetical protein